MGYLVLICLLVIVTYLINKYSKGNELSKRDVLIGWSIKLGFGSLYLFIFLSYYGDGILYGDSNSFF